MELNNISGNTSWTVASSEVNENNRKIVSEFTRLDARVEATIEEVEQKVDDVSNNNKGLFGTLSSLNTQYPNIDNKKDWYAFIGTSNPREKYIVKVDGGAWTPTGDMQNVGDVNMTDYAKKTDITPLAPKVRDDGYQVAYSKDGTIGIEESEEWFIPYNAVVDTVAEGWLFLYENPAVIRGKAVNMLQFNVSKVGKTTLIIATGVPKALTIKRSIDVDLPKLGLCIVQLHEDIILGDNEFIGFDTRNKTGRFKVNVKVPNAVAGGYYFYSSPSENTPNLVPRDMAVGFGVKTGSSYAKMTDVVELTSTLSLGAFSSKEAARNSVSAEFRKAGLAISYTLNGEIVKEFFDSQDLTAWGADSSWSAFVKGKYLPDEIIPFKEAPKTVGTKDLFFYEDQSAIRGKAIDRIRINAQGAGSLGVYISTNMVVGQNRVDVHSFTLHTTKVGDQILRFPEPITLKDDEWLGIGRGTAGFWVDASKKNPVGKGYYFCEADSSLVKSVWVERDLCIGIIEQGADEHLTINGISFDNTTEVKDSVLEMNAHKMGAILSLNKTITSPLATIQKKRLVSFMHITDTHADWVRVGRALDFMNNVPNGCDFGVITGDIVNNKGDAVKPFIDLLKSSLKNVYHNLGNHDVFDVSNANNALYTKFFEPLAQKMQYNNGKNLYYYKDINEIRFIFLHDFDMMDQLTYYSDAQLSWFIETLRDCKYAIICKHHPIENQQINGINIIDGTGKPIEGYNDFFDFNSRTIAPSHYSGNDPIIDIVEAWRTAGSVHHTYNIKGANTGRVDVDFTEKGEFITYLCGHEHYDKFGYVGNTTQLMIVNNCTLMSDVYGDLPRFANTVTQDCINYMNVSLDEKTLTVLRLGSDCAYTGRDRKKICVTWDKDKMINS